MDVIIEDIDVMYVAAEGGSETFRVAFDKLESKLKSLKGRKFYGVFQSGKYKACVAIEKTDNISELGLEKGKIPGGKYVKEKLLNWTQNVEKIRQVFEEMSKKYEEDKTRPSIEFYRSMNELVLLFPVK